MEKIIIVLRKGKVIAVLASNMGVAVEVHDWEKFKQDAPEAAQKLERDTAALQEIPFRERK